MDHGKQSLEDKEKNGLVFSRKIAASGRMMFYSLICDADLNISYSQKLNCNNLFCKLLLFLLKLFCENSVIEGVLPLRV